MRDKGGVVDAGHEESRVFPHGFGYLDPTSSVPSRDETRRNGATVKLSHSISRSIFSLDRFGSGFKLFLLHLVCKK